MHRDLPLYIFLRNTAVLFFAFFLISSIIIEHGRQERGENSLFNTIIIKNSDIRDYNNFDMTKSKETAPLNKYSLFSTNIDSISKATEKSLFFSTLVENQHQSLIVFNQVDL